jgi:hypothetical protein
MLKTLINVLTRTQLDLPAFDLLLLLILLTLALLCRYSRVGLLVAYAFVYRWGWTVSHSLGHKAHVGYLCFGMAVALLAVIGLFVDSRE